MPAKDRNIHLKTMHDGQRFIAAKRGRRSAIRCGRRWGKTTMFEKWAADWSLQGKSVGFFAPTYRLLLPIYRGLERTLTPVIDIATKDEMSILLKTGGKIDFWTLTDENAGRSKAYHEVLIDEASLVPGLQDIFEQSIEPTLLDHYGNATMAGTPKGVDEDSFFYQACVNLPQKWREFHAPTSSNPTLNAAAVAKLEAENHPLVYAQEYKAEFVSWAGQSLISLDKMTIDGKGVGLPQHVAYVFAVIDTAMKDGAEHDGTAVVWCARNQYGTGAPLTILDWEIVQINSDMLETWMPHVFNRLGYWRDACKAQYPNPQTFIEDKGAGIALLQHGERVGWPVMPIDSVFTAAGKDARAVMASSHVWRGDVKIHALALEKTVSYKGVTKNHLVSQVCGYVLGDKAASKRADDLFDSFSYACISALGTGE
ncbi:hypothetical protein [Paraburkholderia sp. C35]|uniref:hypothetical protein n=1 Tax=Paraburkholderia sp. C35 TaxID=2126993 RepID=UPI000D68F97B|nr:hypothetical protein [Paraburkholderia sp. C35]